MNIIHVMKTLPRLMDIPRKIRGRLTQFVSTRPRSGG